MKPSKWFGKAVALALYSVAIAGCSKSGVHPKQVETASLQSAVSDPQVRAFYQARQWQPAWTGKLQAQLLDALGQATANGLRRDLFLKGELPRDPSEREAALTAAALRYGSALARGYLDPAKLGRIYTVPRPNPNVAAGLAQALEHGDLADWFASLPPQTDEYRALSQAHLHFVQLAGRGKPPHIPAGKRLKPGKRDPRVPLVAAALVADGYLDPPAKTEPQPPQQHYSGALVDAVRRLQSDYGLKPDGVIGDDTLDLLNAGPAGLARQLAIAMERLRWLDRDPPPMRIDVNIAGTYLDYWRGGSHVDRRRVVTGEPQKPTPQIQAAFSQLVANPYWRIPNSIYKEELADKGAGYLAKNRMEFRNGRLVQLPGPKNSLGLVKFDVEDPQDIYLHDTPAKALFALPERHRSHGCVRVENALDFAAMLAGEDGVLDRFMTALRSGDERYVKLKTRIVVRLLYHTAFLDGGRVQFRPDVYGWDDEVARGLGFELGPPRKPVQAQGDIGP